MTRTLSIGALAKAVGVKVAMIRVYESIGLLPKPARSQNNYRRYGEDAVHRLRFIGRAQSLGFEIVDIQQLMNLSDRSSTACQEVATIAKRHLAEIDTQLTLLKSAKTEFVRMIQHAEHDYMQRATLSSSC